MQGIREAVINTIYKNDTDDENLINNIESIAKVVGIEAYSIFFNILTHLDLKPNIAQECWDAILVHRKVMINILRRNISIRTVICDYFSSNENILKRPVVVEIQIFEKRPAALKYDALTGLYARNTFLEALSREMSRAKRYETNLSLLFLDLDDFRNINDTFGYLAGDQVLKDVGKIVKEEIRTEDFAARYSDEKIVIILPETNKVDALVLGERIRKKVESLTCKYEDNFIQPTISGGVASYPIDTQHITDLVKFADNALYRAKGFGKNNTATYSLNKRRYLRINFFKKIQVRKIGFYDTHLSVEAISKNISVTGLLFESNEYIEFGTKVELRIPIPDGGGVFVAVGVVVRVEFFNSTYYDIGVSFLDLDKNAKQEISKYMIRQLEIDAA
jgi:diguanylate cyclase (GGDEF)-like protein